MTKCNEQTTLLDSIELLYLDGEQIVLKGSVPSVVTGFMNNWKIAKADYLGQGGRGEPSACRAPHGFGTEGCHKMTPIT